MAISSSLLGSFLRELLIDNLIEDIYQQKKKKINSLKTMGLDPVLVMPKSCCPLGGLVFHCIVLLIFKFIFCHFI